MSATDNYKTIPPLAAYIDRVGARQLNFRRFMIQEDRGPYYIERVLIKLTADGEVVTTSEAHKPTKDEAIAIKEALLRTNFPRAAKVSMIKARELVAKVDKTSTLYYVLDRDSGEVIFIQERREVSGKGKTYWPWTFFSDGEWRQMEPDGALPFWKPPGKKKPEEGQARIMIHEGAKPAEAVTRMVANKKSDHPWIETLRLYEHWGMLGGAFAPHRADYKEIKKVNPVEVIYVCDNDFPGRAALQEVSRGYGRAMKGIMFDPKWPEAWDMADPMPREFYPKGVYIGPQLHELMLPATRATETKPNPAGNGRPVTVLRPDFREEWVHSVSPEVLIHVDWPSTMHLDKEFNSMIKPFSDVDDTARLVRGDAANKSAIIKYDPSLPKGIYGGDEGRYINTHSPSEVKEAAGSAKPFEDFMEHLCPEEKDREELIRWCATLVARPEVKMTYGVLLISERQGIGKGTLGEKILAPLIGRPNVSTPSENEIVDSSFNYWLAHKRLAVIHEIYAGESSKAYNRLKSIITDRFVTVSKKYMATYEIENWVHIFACSNSQRALKLTIDDRRWFVPRITEEKKPHGYWNDLNTWLVEERGLGIIKRWMGEWVKKHGAVERGAAAPWSGIKKEMIEEGYSQGQALVASFLTKAAEEMPDERLIVMDMDLVLLVRTIVYHGRQSEYLERPLTLRNVARSMGWHVNKGKVPGSLRWNRAANGYGHALCSHLDDSQRSPAELAKQGLSPLKVMEKAQIWGFLEV